MGIGVYGENSPLHVVGRARKSRLTGGVGGPDKVSPSSIPEMWATASQGHPAAKGGPPTRSSRPSGWGAVGRDSSLQSGGENSWDPLGAPVPHCLPPTHASHSSLLQDCRIKYQMPVKFELQIDSG